MKWLLRAFTPVYLLVSSQHCILPEVELASEPTSPIEGVMTSAQSDGASTPVTPPESGESAASADEPASSDMPQDRADASPQGAPAAMPMMPVPGVEPPAMSASAPAASKPPGGFKAVCDSNADCQAKLLCHKGLCKRDNSEPCEEDGECAFESCYRTCRAALPVGGVCDSEADCVPPSLCMMNTCRHLNGLTCSFNYQCASGSCVTRVCVEPESRTGPCQSDENCKPDLVCLQFQGGSPARYCERKGLFPVGAFCKADTDCRDGNCGQNVCAEPTVSYQFFD